MVNRYRADKAYEGTPPVTRFFGTACFLINIATFFGLINVFHFVFDLQSVLQKYEYWRFLTSFLHFGFAFGSPVVTPPVRYIFVLVQFHRYMLNLENFYFHERRGAFIKMMLFFMLGSAGYGVIMNRPMFLGPVLRAAVITVWAHVHRRDFMRNLAGFELNFWNAKNLPYVYVIVLAFLDFPLSISEYSAIPAQIYGIILGNIYIYLMQFLKAEPEEDERPQFETFEFVEPVEFFTYLAIAVLTGGKFM